MTPNVGVTYSGSHAKQEEHGGFAHDDTNVIMLLSNPDFHADTVRTSVGTVQVAPTILQALGIDPSALNAVRVEGTSVLPAVQLQGTINKSRINDRGRSVMGVPFLFCWNLTRVGSIEALRNESNAVPSVASAA